jgi:hypothetical protein
MKKSTFVILFIICSSFTFAQVELKGTMGIYFLSIPSMQDYVNQSFAPPDDQLSSFVSSVMFAGEGGLFVSENFEASVELAYQIYSYTTNSDAGKYELAYNNIMPSLIGYYVLFGNGYNIKFGGGVGVRFATVDQSLPATGSTVTYNSIGYGFIGRIEGNTQLSGSVYANIGADIRYDINREPDYKGVHLYNNIQQENVNFNTFALGIRLGITYIIGGNN